MTTFATLKARIASELARSEAAFATFVSDAVLTAVQDYEAMRFHFNTARYRLNTVAGQESYTIPTDLRTPANASLAAGESMLEIDSARLRWQNTSDYLRAVSPEWIDLYTTTATRGQPTYYSRLVDEIRLCPIPDQVYEVYFYGLKRFPALSADGDTNPWTTDAEKLIRARAKKTLLREVLQDFEHAAAVDVTENEALMTLSRKMAAHQPQRIMPWGY